MQQLWVVPMLTDISSILLLIAWLLMVVVAYLYRRVYMIAKEDLEDAKNLNRNLQEYIAQRMEGGPQ